MHSLKHLVTMKGFLVFLSVVVSICANSQTELEALNVKSFTATFRGHNGDGKIVYDSLNQKQSFSYYCNPNESPILFYVYKEYYKNEVVKYDSILDLSRAKYGKLTVVKRNPAEKKIYSKKLKANLNKRRTEIPKREDLVWSGKVIYYQERGKTVQTVKDVSQ